MKLITKYFNELTTEELFEIYKLRSAVFVVEQTCIYQDIDDYDKRAVHVWFEEEGKMLAYLRVLPAGTTFEAPSIGRVISVRRREGIGSLIVSEGIRIAKEAFGALRIVIEAQVYARTLYEKLGFVQISEEFLEDGIPHIRMEYRF